MPSYEHSRIERRIINEPALIGGISESQARLGPIEVTSETKIANPTVARNLLDKRSLSDEQRSFTHLGQSHKCVLMASIHSMISCFSPAPS